MASNYPVSARRRDRKCMSPRMFERGLMARQFRVGFALISPLAKKKMMHHNDESQYRNIESIALAFNRLRNAATTYAFQLSEYRKQTLELGT
jgi:hypothetical protein